MVAGFVSRFVCGRKTAQPVRGFIQDHRRSALLGVVISEGLADSGAAFSGPCAPQRIVSMEAAEPHRGNSERLHNGSRSAEKRLNVSSSSASSSAPL